MADDLQHQASAVFSPCRRYRYELRRTWDPSLGLVAFVGLNPSTADEMTDDMTIRKCVGFARRWGCGGIVMLNLFAWRATDPSALCTAPDPIGSENDQYLEWWLCDPAPIEFAVAAWGNSGTLDGRDRRVVDRVTRHCVLRCLGMTKASNPRHPSRIRYTTPLEVFAPIVGKSLLGESNA